MNPQSWLRLRFALVLWALLNGVVFVLPAALAYDEPNHTTAYDDGEAAVGYDGAGVLAVAEEKTVTPEERALFAKSAEFVAAKGAGDLPKLGRSGKQARLRELATDPTVSSANREWIRQEINSIERGQRTNIRVPPGKNLAHRRGLEAKKGYGYEHSDLQDIDLHKLQHKHKGY